MIRRRRTAPSVVAVAAAVATSMLGAGAVYGVVGGTSGDAGAPVAGTLPASAPMTPTATPTPSPVEPVAPVDVPDDVAATLALVDSLEVKGRAPMTGYDRDLYGSAWTDTDRNGCDQRNDVLRRDLDDIVTREGTEGCVVLSGSYVEPYSGQYVDFRRGPQSGAVQIDHVVALGDSWAKGAQQLSEDERREFANDPLNLLAVDGRLNQQKSDGDAATWLPPNKDYRCSYVARQVQVKAKYGLWVTAAEADAMQRVLSGCSTVAVDG